MPLQRDKVILVNKKDEWVGIASKESAHHNGLLHRAVSVFIRNSKGEILLQQRASGKYHSGGLWSNACCSHPAPGESSLAAARRRLQEEMGISTALDRITTHYYTATVSSSMQEHELDHIFSGTYDGNIEPNPEEVMDWKWITEEALAEWLHQSPDQFTAWFQPIYNVWLNMAVTLSQK